MRMPRLRFTIGGLMVAVLVASLVLWRVSVRLGLAQRQAQASYQQAKLVREVAEYALKEYQEGVYLQDKATCLGQIALAEANLERARDRLEWSTKMHAKAFLSKPSHISNQLAEQKADFDLEQARMQYKVLEKYTKDKQTKMLQSDIQKARSDEQSKLATCQMQQSRRWRIPGF